MSVTAVQAEKHLEVLSAYGAVKDRLAESGLADSAEENMRIVIDKMSSVLNMLQDNTDDLDDVMYLRNSIVDKYDKFEIDYASVLASLVDVHEEGLSYTSEESAKSLSNKSQSLVKASGVLLELLSEIDDRIIDVEVAGDTPRIVNELHSAIDQSSQVIQALSSAAFQSSVFADSLVEDSAA